MQGPAIFLAQFIDKAAPFNSLNGLCEWAAILGYKAIQLPTWEKTIFDLELAANSKTYCDEVMGVVSQASLKISELSTHLQGQLIASHPAYSPLFDGFAAKAVRGNDQARQQWAEQQLYAAAKASAHLGLKAHATFSGALLWHLTYPWPQRPPGLVEEAFQELARRWHPILWAFDDAGVDICYELHPGEDLFDGITFERFLDAVDRHPRANILYDPSHLLLQQLDYLAFIDIYHTRIKAFHVKDAEFNPTGRCGVYGGYLDWRERPGRFRSLGDGQVDFKGIFSRLLQYNYQGWAVLEWECCLKNASDGAREGADFIAKHMINITNKKFDDFSATNIKPDFNKRILGIK